MLASLSATAGYLGFSPTLAPRAQRTHVDMVAAPPRATPKATGSGKPDPLDWSAPSRPPKRPSDYELNLGKAIDTLRQDSPRLFLEKPDFSIFSDSVSLHDPSGKRLQGVSQYERVFDMLRFLRRTAMQDAELTYRLVCHDDTIRVRWTAKMQVRDPAFGLTQLNIIDGVSVYEMDSKGKISKHSIETIVMANDGLAQPLNLGLLWPTPQMATPEMAMPFFRTLDAALADRFDASRAQLPMLPMPPRLRPSRSAQRARDPQASIELGGEGVADETPMQRAAREREEDAEKARRLAELRAPKNEKKKKGGLFGFSGPQECETSYDCDAPMVCCDLLMAKVCCSGGMMVPRASPEMELQRRAIPIPVEKDSPFPPGFPGPGGSGAGGAPKYPY